VPDLTVWPTDGADGSVSSEARWRKMGRLWVPSGVDASLLGIAGQLVPTLAAGPTINVAAGSCWLDGHYAERTTPASVPATANGLLVVRFTPADNHAELLYRDAAVTCTQTLATWELPIAQMLAGAMRDIRWIQNARSEIGFVQTYSNVSIPSQTPPTAPITVNDLPAIYCDGGPVEIEAVCTAVGISAAGGLVYLRAWVDNAEVTNGHLAASYSNLATSQYGRIRSTPAAGVHQFRSRGSLAGTLAGTTGAFNVMQNLSVRRL